MSGIDISAEWNQPNRGLTGEEKRWLAITIRPIVPAMPNVTAVALLDVSSSMEGERFNHAATAIKSIWRRMRPGDSLAIITFATRVVEALDWAVKGAASDSVVDTALAKIKIGGATQLSEGLRRALGKLTGASGLRNLWLITDGDPTNALGKPAPDTAPFITAVESASREGIITGAVALGDAAAYNVNFLRDMADRGKGIFCYAETARELEAELARQLDAAHSTTSGAGTLAIHTSPNFKPVSAFRITPEYAPLGDCDGASPWVIDFGAVSSPETVIVVEATTDVPFGSEPGVMELGKAVAGGVECDITINLSPPNAANLYHINQQAERLRINVEIARNAELRARASDPAEKSSATEKLLSYGRMTGAPVNYAADNVSKAREIRELVNLRRQGGGGL